MRSPSLALSITIVSAALVAGCTSRQDAADEEGTVPVLSALTGPACSNHSVQVLDLHADFRDIWAGREAAATGKQADPGGQVAVDFSTTVQASFVNATFSPADTSGKCGGVVAATPGATIAGPAVWGSLTTDQTRPTTPSPFNLIVREAASGIVSAGGPVAAGGDVTLSSFSVNGTARQPVGLIAGGRATLVNGSIAGDLTYGTASTVPGTVTITGKKSQLAYDVTASFKRLESLSTLLSGMAATGTVQSSGGNLTLTGKSTGLNVFQISADALKQASSIAITVPANSAAIFNVSGASVDVSNKGVTLSGATTAKMLWNFPAARFLHVASIGLSGSMLAPRANFTFDSGSVSGTVVARSFLGAGSGTLLHTPLNVASVFTQATPSEVALMAQTPLVGGCTYQFRIPSSPALTSSGACLAAPLSVTFIVARHPVSPPTRELQNLQVDTETRTLGRFTARANINTPVEDALARYESAIGISAADLVANGTPVPSATRKGHVVTQYQQYTQGYPVAGYGYFVSSANGIFRSANGRVAPSLPALPVVPAQTITSGTALQKALAYLKITQPPWVKTPAQYKAPVGTLVVVAKKTFPAASDFVLAWTFPFGKTTGIANPADIQVDAVTGSVIAASPGFIPITSLDPHSTYQGQVDANVDTIYSGARTFSAAQYKAPDNALVTTLSSKAFNAEGALITATGVTTDTNNALGGAAQYPLDPTPTTPWTTTEPHEQAMASAEWALQTTDTFLKSLGLQVAGNPWQSVDGVGHRRVIVNYFITPLDLGGAFFQAGNPDTANIFVTIQPDQVPVEPDTISHEFSHAILDGLRQADGLDSLQARKESGAINEGLADLYSIAFNHKSGVSSPWSCVNLSASGAILCAEDIANPHATRQPELYGEIPGFVDYSAYDPSQCTPRDANGDGNDDCGVHDNSTIVSHWGYLLAAGSSALSTVPCNLQVAPLASDIDTAFRTVLEIAYLAAGTRTGLGGAGLASEATFAQFRDATMQVAEELVSEGTLPSDAVAKTALAWAAVGLPPRGGAPTIAAPANNTTDVVYPWTTFVWPTAGEDSQTGSSWDFQIEDGSLASPVAYAKDGITDTVTQDGKTLGALDLALPYDSDDTFLWRVRPHADGPWQICQPVYSFLGTGEPDPITDLTITSETDPATNDFLPGPISLSWTKVQGAHHYEVTLATTDLGCAPDSTAIAGTFPASSGTGTFEATISGVQPEEHYFLGVQAVGPEDFFGNRARGACVKLELDTAPMRAPTLAQPVDGDNRFAFHPEDGGSMGHTNPHWVWYGLDGPSKYQVQFFEITSGGACSDTAKKTVVESYEDDGKPCPLASCIGANYDLLFPSPNPTGYCWNVTSIAANGKVSPPSETWRFLYVDFAPNKVSPGIQIGAMATLGETSILEGNSYGTPVTFQWDAAPDAVGYKFKIGRYPWATPLATPDPVNCWVPLGFDASFSCTSEPVEVTDNQTVADTGLILDGQFASQGRYCWTIWPIIAGDRQPLVDSFPPLCYASGPAKPEITCDHVPADGAYTGETIACTATDAYVPAGQFKVLVSIDGHDPGDQLEIVSVCKPDPDPPQPHDATFGDIYDCEKKFNIHPQPKQHVTILGRTWNSGENPPVMDESSQLPDVAYEFDTGSCGGNGEPCCVSATCKEGDPGCDHLICDPGAVCNPGSSRCLPCGEKGDDCCPGKMCNASGLVCAPNDAVPTKQSCEPCGDQGLDCCAGDSCASKQNCVADESAATKHRCKRCGDEGLECCTGNECNVSSLVCAPDGTCEKKPVNLPSPALLFDAVCDPVFSTSLWTDGNTTFAIKDVPGADELEFEFIDPDTGLLTARTLATNCATFATTDEFCPAVGNDAVLCEIPPKEDFEYHWSDELENEANDFAAKYRNGFRFALFRVRGIDSSGGQGPFSREGLMISCIEPGICTLDSNDGVFAYPHVDVPVPNVPPPLLHTTCDDYMLHLIVDGRTDCIQWQ